MLLLYSLLVFWQVRAIPDGPQFYFSVLLLGVEVIILYGIKMLCVHI